MTPSELPAVLRVSTSAPRAHALAADDPRFKELFGDAAESLDDFASVISPTAAIGHAHTMSSVGLYGGSLFDDESDRTQQQQARQVDGE